MKIGTANSLSLILCSRCAREISRVVVKPSVQMPSFTSLTFLEDGSNISSSQSVWMTTDELQKLIQLLQTRLNELPSKVPEFLHSTNPMWDGS